jgi:hypothetical protein
MFDEVLPIILTDGLWLLIAAGWILLITIGLEVDKPLSGGIPGHISADDEQNEDVREGIWGRVGVISSWITFGLVTLSLPFILYWSIAVHAR